MVCVWVATSAQAGFNYEAEVLSDNPIAYWRFEETSGLTAADSSPNAKDATHVGGTSVGVTGYLGNGVHYNGAGARTETDGTNYWTPTISGPGDGWSVEVWLRPSRTLADGDNRNAISWNGPFTQTYRVMQRGNDNNQAGAWVRDAGGNSGVVTGGDPIDDGEWHHVVLTFGLDAGSNPFRNLYVDGGAGAQ